jgi:hypothetical protein
MENHKTTYILVHGAWHGSWCWKRVRAALQSAGHSVFTPTLTGLGKRSHLNSAAVDLSTNIADIVNLIKWEAGGSVQSTVCSECSNFPENPTSGPRRWES